MQLKGQELKIMKVLMLRIMTNGGEESLTVMQQWKIISKITLL